MFLENETGPSEAGSRDVFITMQLHILRTVIMKLERNRAFEFLPKGHASKPGGGANVVEGKAILIMSSTWKLLWQSIGY